MGLRQFGGMTYLNLILALACFATPVIGAGSEPVPLGADGPWIAIPAGAPIDLGPLSQQAIAVLADLDGNPHVTTAKEAAMIIVLMQVLGVAPSGEMHPTD